MLPSMFRVAAKVAMSKKDKRNYCIGAVGIRHDGTIVKSRNSSAPNDRNPKVHAEYKLSKKLDKYATVFVVRIRPGDKSFALAKPCPDCERVLRSKKVRTIYYSISNYEYGVISLIK